MTTKVSPEQVKAQANRHDATADNVSQQLDQLKAQVEATLAASPSAATRALSSTADQWIESVRTAVLAKLREMGQTMRTEVGAQQEQDDTARSAITNVPVAVGNFLGA
ncbi:hypothetical protein [Lentzea sp. NBRC 102530]|uniref:hypothetical protein n=1 Tax=Lentzea sp. NBRC 102530 TaxID=3032201 RepID=UPI0024A0E327|nr:hypothetical protein [Lentzea sp. NBRC 102530]GLY46814.1 hypothetical protein Lesp01_04700 [Lentzea sp. NBRC 102530]